MKYIDIHTHKKQNIDTIQLLDLSDEIDINTGRQNYYSLGIHPWYVKESMLDNELERIEKYIQTKSFLAIGECGIDKVCDTALELQSLAFKKQIFLSEKYKKPLILHIVKAFNELINLRIALKAKQVWIVHGFNGSPQLAKQLMELGMYISFGAQLDDDTSKASRSINSVSIRRVFLETDNSVFTIKEIYALAAERLNMDVDQLKKQLWQNYQTVFS